MISELSVAIPVRASWPPPLQIRRYMPPGSSSTHFLRVAMPSYPFFFYHPRFSRRSFTFLCSRNRLVSENSIYDGSEPPMFAGTGVKSFSAMSHCGLESRASRRTQSGFRNCWLGRRICHRTSTSTLSGSQVGKISPCSLDICPALANSAFMACLRWTLSVFEISTVWKLQTLNISNSILSEDVPPPDDLNQFIDLLSSATRHLDRVSKSTLFP